MHIFEDNAAYTVIVCVTDDEGARTCDTMVVNAGNAAPVVAAGAAKTAQEGALVTIETTTFTDAGESDTHTATITWGDGSTSAGTVVQAAGEVTASHAYADDGAFTVTVRVCDDDGGCDQDTLTVTVGNAAPEILSLQLASAGSEHVEQAAPLERGGHPGCNWRRRAASMSRALRST